MNPQRAIIVIIAALCVSHALAEDFKTIEGKEYKDVTVTRVEPDGIVLTTKTGISKVYFAELPQDVQERFLPSTPKAGAAQQGLIMLKSWTASAKNPTSFVLFLIGAVSLIAAGLFWIVRSLFRRQPTIRKNLSEVTGKSSKRRRL